MPKKRPETKRDDSSVKIDSGVLLRLQLIVSWRKHTNEEDEHLSVAEYLSDMAFDHSAAEYEEAVKWHSQQLKKKRPHDAEGKS